MKPSISFKQRRTDIRQVASRFPVANPRVFGSVLHGEDADGSDLDLLVDPLPGTTLFDLGGLQAELEDLLGVPVDVVTPGESIAKNTWGCACGGATGMKHAPRLPDYLEHMQQAAAQAIDFVEGTDLAAFLGDRRTQQAVIFNLVILGEAASKVLADNPVFAEKHKEIPWRSIRATRNRLAHGYLEINLDLVWDTVRTALPELLSVLPAALDAARREAGATPPPTVAS